MKVVITGVTGMVGEGVLLECLEHPNITEILSVSRRPSGRVHAKLKEYIVPDFLSLPENDEKLRGYDACFYCAGISSVGVKEPVYRQVTYDTTMAFANALKPNPRMTFLYVSGAGTDSSEKGRIMWARVKGKTENDLMQLPFKQSIGFRPAFMKPVKEQKNLPSFYKFVAWLFPIFSTVFPGIINTMEEIALAMIEVAQHGYEKGIIEVKDIRLLATRAKQK
ncbi:MAG TPA: NAD-dependent epimerase/dehydratase family protein [Pseudosphingobacterium sp.]|nr:NAD-dependent epimerase/dehydratase family protein [Pseudosphingobacterium sp.]